MKWIHVKACFESSIPDIAEDLVSDLFFSLGIKGVVCDVPMPEPEEGYASDALPLPTGYSISGYLPDTPLGRQTLDTLCLKAEAFDETLVRVGVSTRIVDQEDWAESWKDFFYTHNVTDRLVIRPIWRDYNPKEGEIIIDIDPGMAFGTGTHPTTAMCLAMIEEYIVPGQTFLDVGTGSGILMIAAAKLGAGRLVGIDTDEVAVKIAEKNLCLNTVDPTAFRLFHTTLEDSPANPGKGYDLIVANIIAEVIAAILPELKNQLAPDGTAILSGIINDRLELVHQALALEKFCILETRITGEWVALAVSHQPEM